MVNHCNLILPLPQVVRIIKLQVMTVEKSQIESESQPRDISEEFSNMDMFVFLDFLRTLRKEPALSIVVNWKDKYQARRLKAFLENIVPGQKKFATIRATRKQMEEEPNVFSSGVKWIEVKEND